MLAAILDKIGAPLSVAEIDLPEKLEHGQVLVSVLCTSICGSQLQEIDGIKGDPAHLPHLLGHEGCGIVEDIGEGVTTVKKGDRVVMHWRKGAGIEGKLPFYQWDGIDKSHRWVKAGPITTFSEMAIVSENRVTAIPWEVPNHFAALLGCALSTALSLIEKEAKPKSTDRVLVIGCGGLGLALIIALKRAGVKEVFANDRCKQKRAIIEKLGAKFIFRPNDRAELVIDTIHNRPWTTGQRYISLQNGGTSGGGFNPVRDIPRYVADRIPGWQNLITHQFCLDDINYGIQAMREGKAGRVMINMR